MNNTPIRPDQPFVGRLLEQKGYTSPHPYRRVRFAALRYLSGILGIVVKSAWVARHNRFTNQDFFNRSIAAIRLVERVGGTVEIQGLAHLADAAAPVVVVANHMSLLEAFMLPCLIIPFSPLCVVIKKELTTYPGFGRAMRTLNHIAVSRDNPRADFRTVMEEGLQFLQQGISVLIFPQATRNSVFNPTDFNTLGEKLAARARVPVIPVALKTDLHGNGRLFKEFGQIDPSRPVRVAFGPPVNPALDGRQAHDQIIRFIVDQLRAWGLPVADAVSEPERTAP